MRLRLRLLAAFDWVAEQEDDRPAAEWLPRRTRGRASVLTRMVAEVTQGAAANAGIDLATCPLVLGSAHGELATTMRLLDMMHAGDGALSPARFQASVHNTAASVISIATTSRAFSTSLAAGTATTAAVLQEAGGWLACNAGPVIAVVADERLPEFFGQDDDAPAAAAALVLDADGPQGAGPSLSLETIDGLDTPPRPTGRGLCALAAAARAGENLELDLPAVGGGLRLALTHGDGSP